MARIYYPASYLLIGELRTAAGLTQEELAHRCGFADPRIIYDMESEKMFNRGRKFEFESLEIVAKALRVPVAVLIYLPMSEIEMSREPHTWLTVLAKAWGIPADAVNHWSSTGTAEGKVGRVMAMRSAGRLLTNGNLFSARSKGKAASGYLGCSLFVDGRTIDLPVIPVSGQFTEFFDIAGYTDGEFSVALWSRKVKGRGSYDRANGYHMEGRIATTRGVLTAAEPSVLDGEKREEPM